MKKILVMLLVAILALGLTSVLAEEAVTVVDFEDGLCGFMAVEKLVGNAGDAAIELAEFNGSTALKVTVPAKVPYIVIDVEGLVGAENVANVRGIKMDVGIDNAEDGKFYAVSGNIYAYYGADDSSEKTGWSVYMAKKNPYTVGATLSDDAAFVAGVNNRFVITK